MWKDVLGSRSTWIRQQVRDHLDGRLLANPHDPCEIAEMLQQKAGNSALHHEVEARVQAILRQLRTMSGRSAPPGPSLGQVIGRPVLALPGA
jgi:hypothetical protein